MPKAKKRKIPIAQTSYTTPSTNAQVCRKTINQFHILLKRRSQLENVQDPSPIQAEELAEIAEEIARLGGLEKYQQMSVNGQKDERGGGSEKIFIAWMKELGLHHTHGGNNRLRCAIDMCLCVLLAYMKQAPRSWRT
jgi:25S rRNA (adenine2142-N1)-methyltransferase